MDDIPERFYTETALFHFGSISLLRGTTPATVLSTVEHLKGRALLSFDLNIRTGLIRDELAYRAVLAHLIMLTDILKLSEMDLAWLLPGVPVEEALLQLSKQGPALVLITRGEHGILAQRNLFDAIHVPAFSVPVVDTVGAGDAICAGVLAQLAGKTITSREELIELPTQEVYAILQFASAVAAVNCIRASADPPSLAEVQQFLQKESGVFE